MPPSKPVKTVYQGTFIHLTSLTTLEVLEDAAVYVDIDGVIKMVQREGDGTAAMKNVLGWDESEVKVVRMGGKGKGKGKGRFWFPGFVDTHIHASQFPNAGIFGKSTLMDWLETYTYPLESSFSSLDTAKRIYTRCIKRTLAHGTTTAAYYATIHAPATNLLSDVCLSLGQRAFIGRCNMDSDIHLDYYRDASAESAIRDTKDTIEHIKSIDPTYSLITPIITPRFAPSCTRPLMTELGNLHKETGLPIQTHISENPGEIKMVKNMFPEYDSYAAVYDAYGLLTDKTLLAHACHFSPSEVELVKTRKSKVSHCPISNSYLGSGICPVRELLEEGIDVGLGTDVSGGWSPSILTAAREAGGVSRLRTALVDPSMEQAEKDKMKLSTEECLYLATRGGAKCVGLEKRIGGFELGMTWDAQLIDLGSLIADDGEDGGVGGVDLWGKENWEGKLAKWIHCGDDRNTKAVWVGGSLVSGSMPSA
ncbi:MAG: hypothetical protein MMC33_001409 [Icmadophila ericetorum]|nr:hypothetical protein [Icmadophila ericetorum]